MYLDYSPMKKPNIVKLLLDYATPDIEIYARALLKELAKTETGESFTKWASENPSKLRHLLRAVSAVSRNTADPKSQVLKTLLQVAQHLPSELHEIVAARQAIAWADPSYEIRTDLRREYQRFKESQHQADEKEWILDWNAVKSMVENDLQEEDADRFFSLNVDQVKKVLASTPAQRRQVLHEIVSHPSAKTGSFVSSIGSSPLMTSTIKEMAQNDGTSFSDNEAVLVGRVMTRCIDVNLSKPETLALFEYAASQGDSEGEAFLNWFVDSSDWFFCADLD